MVSPGENSRPFQSGAPNLNLDILLGGEEWTGLPPDRSAMGAYVSSSTVNANDGSFKKKPSLGVDGYQQGTGQQAQQQSVQFQDLEPGMLGWGLEGF